MVFLKNLSFALLLTFFILESNAQNLQWALQIGNPNSFNNNEECGGVKTDTIGNVYVIGTFYATVDLDPAVSTQYTLTSTTANTKNAFFAKYSPNGQIIWGNNLDVTIYTLEVDKDGSVILFGLLTKDTDMDPSTNNYTALLAGGANFVAKYSSNGDFLWFKSVNDYCTASAIDPIDGSIYSGSTKVTKLSAYGNKAWEYSYPLSSGSIGLQAMNVDKNQNLVVNGTYTNTANFNLLTTPSFNLPNSGSLGDPFVAKYGPDGTLKWAINLVGDNEEYGGNVETDEAGDIYITGMMNSSQMEFDPSLATSTIGTSLANSSYLAKYTTNGTLVWAHINPFYPHNSLALDKNNRVYVLGWYLANQDVDPSANIVTSSIGGNYLAAFNKDNGDFIWFESVSTASNSSNANDGLAYLNNALAIDKFNNLIATGKFTYGTPSNDFDPSPNFYPLYLSSPNNIMDGFLTKYYPYQLQLNTDKGIYCQGETVRITSTALGYFPNNNTFKIELSDAAGSFTSALTLATFTGSATGLATYTIPGNMTPSNGYLIRFSTSYPSYAPLAIQPISIRSGVLVLSSISGSSVACFNDSNRAFSIATLPGLSYLWSSPANSTITGSNSNAQVNIKFQSYASPGNLKVRQTNAQGCFGDVQTTITSLPLPISPPIIGPATVCGNALYVGYTVPGGTLSTYFWSSTNSGIYIGGTTSNTSANFNIVSPGSISVTETDKYGCVGAPVSMTIHPWAVPIPATISGVNAVCRNTTNVVYQVPSVNGINYSWNLPALSTSAGSNALNTLTVNFTNYTIPGILKVNQTNAFGCFVSNALSIGTLPSPITTSIAGPASICGNAQNLSYSVIPNSLSTTNWQLSIPAIINSSTSGTLQFNAYNFLNNGIVSATETNQYGCQGIPSVLTITAFAVPNTPPINGPASICGNAQNVKYAVPAPNTSTYSWTSTSLGISVLGNGTSASLNFNLTTPSILQVQETSVNGCVGNPVQTTLTPYTIPTPATLSGILNVCPNQSNVVYQISTVSGISYSWTVPNGTTVLGTNTLNTLTVTFANFTAPGTISVTQTNVNNCTVWSYLNVSPNPIPVTSPISGPASICGNAMGTTFYIVPNTLTSLNWSIPSSLFIVSTTSSSITVNTNNFTSTGFVSVYETNALGCKGNISSLSIIPLVVPLTPAIQGPTTICGNAQNVAYKVAGSPSSSYFWQNTTTGIQISSTGTLASLNFNFVGNSKLTVKETAINGCSGNPVSTNITAFNFPSSASILGPSFVCPSQSNVFYYVNYQPNIAYQWVSPSLSTISGANTNYSVFLNFINLTSSSPLLLNQTLSNGCVAQSQLNITPYSLPITSSITGPTSVCGNALNLTYSVVPNNQTNLTWNFTFPVFNLITSTNSRTVSLNSITSGGFVSVTETDLNGCTSKPSILAVTVLPVPTTPVIIGPSSLCGKAINITYTVAGYNPSSQFIWTSPLLSINSSITTSGFISFNLDVPSLGNDVQMLVSETNAYGCSSNYPGQKFIRILETPFNSPINGPNFQCNTDYPIYFSTYAYGSTNLAWTKPSNSTFENGTDAANGSYIYLKFNDYSGGVIKLIQTSNSSGCQRFQSFTITGIPDPTILSPTYVCPNSSNISTFTLVGINIPGATYNWYTQGNKVGTSSDQKQVIYNYLQGSSLSMTVGNVYSCYKNINLPISYEKSPNPPTLIGPDFLCPGITNVTYRLSNTNKGYTYNWKVDPMFANSTVVNDSTFNANISNLLGFFASGQINVTESNKITSCPVTNLSKIVTGNPPFLGLNGRFTTCDTNQVLNVGSRISKLGYSYNWFTSGPIRVVNGQNTNKAGVKLKYGGNGGLVYLALTNEIGCTITSPGTSVNMSPNPYKLSAPIFTCTDSVITLTLSNPSGLDPLLNQLDFCLTFNPALVSIPQLSPKFNSPAYYYYPDVTYTIINPGQIQVTLKRSIYTNNGSSTLLNLFFKPNYNSLSSGDSIVFGSCGFTESFSDQSVQSCYSIKSTAKFSPPNSVVSGQIFYRNVNILMPLGYDSNSPNRFNPTFIYTSTNTICSSISNPILPDINGNFSQDLSFGDNVHLERQILPTASVITFINSVDAKKIYDIIHGYSILYPNMPPDILDLWAADVDKSGIIDNADYLQVLNRTANGKFTQVDNRNLSWSFVDKATWDRYISSIGDYTIFDRNSLMILVTNNKLLPVIPECIPVPKKVFGSCVDVQKMNFTGILLGDMNIDYFNSSGHFYNAPNSGIRSQEDTTQHPEVIVDLTEKSQLPGGKVQFPLYINASDTASSFDFYWEYDPSMISFDSIVNVPDLVNNKFVFTWNKIGQNIIQLSGFNPGTQPIYSFTNVLKITASLSGSGNPFTNTSLSLINGSKANGIVRTTDVTGHIETRYSIKPFLYPNPGDGTVKIGGLKNAVSISVSIHVYNSLGVEVYSQDKVSDVVYLGHLANGVYYLKIWVDSKEYTLPYTKL